MPEDEVLSMSGDIDTDALLQQFESEWQDTENPEPEQTDEPIVEEGPDAQGDGEAVNEGEGDPEETDNQDPQNDPDLHKRNEAFKRQREEIKELKRYKEFVERMAQDNGLEDPNQIFEAYNEQALAREAEERGIDLQSMKEIDAARRQNEEKAIEEQRNAFMQERADTIEKYQLDDDQVQAIHDYVIENDLQNLGFEQAYKLANFDSLIDNAKSEGRNQYLSDKKKRQQSAAVNVGDNNVSNSDVSSGDLTDDEFAKTLAKMGIEL